MIAPAALQTVAGTKSGLQIHPQIFLTPNRPISIVHFRADSSHKRPYIALTPRYEPKLNFEQS
jgi:hypothetical protein